MPLVALLRAINVGGANPMSMKELKEAFESAGMTSVRTYINSGNVIFESELTDRAEITRLLEAGIEARFGFPIRVLVLDADEIRSVAAAIPEDWSNDDRMRCTVMYLWPELDEPAVLERLPRHPEFDTLIYTKGAVIHKVDRAVQTRSRVTRIVGTPMFLQLTSRNCNTARKLVELVGK
jgi:uncharacterized protein (DUF1697 family)